jgi:hypothetical protein
MSTPQMLEVLEGRHVARNTPMFEFFDKFVNTIKELEKVDSRFLDGLEDAWKKSPAGRMSALRSSWEELFLKLQDSGLNDKIVNGLKGLIDTLATLDPQWIQLAGNIALVTAVATPLASITLAVAGALGSLWAALKIGSALLGALGFGGGGGGAAVGGAAAGGGWLARLGLGGLLAFLNYGLFKLGDAVYESTDAELRELIAKRDGIPVEKVKTWQDYLSWLTPAEAAPSPGAVIANAGPVVARGEPPHGGRYQYGEEFKYSKFDAQPDTGAVVNGINGAMHQVRAIVAGVDLTAEGTRIANTLANGIKAGLPAIQSAASQAAAAAARSALRGSYTDGGK